MSQNPIEIIFSSTSSSEERAAAQAQIPARWIDTSLDSFSAELYREMGWSGASHWSGEDDLPEAAAFRNLASAFAHSSFVTVFYSSHQVCGCELHDSLDSALEAMTRGLPFACLTIDTSLRFAINYCSVDDHWECAGPPPLMRHIHGCSQKDVLAKHVAYIDASPSASDIIKEYNAFHRRLAEHIRSHSLDF